MTEIAKLPKNRKRTIKKQNGFAAFAKVSVDSFRRFSVFFDV